MEELTLDALLERIKSDDADVRTAAWLGAGVVGAPAIQPLASVAADSEAKVKRLQAEVKKPKTKEEKEEEKKRKEQLAQALEVGRAAKRAMWQIVRTVGAPGRDTCKASAEAELIRLLAEGRPDAIRREALWMLSEIGGEKTIDAIRDIPNILDNKAIREDARCCVERIPGRAAVEALQEGLEAAPADFALALAQSLRARGVNVDKNRYPCQKLVPTRQTQVKPVEG